MGTNETSTYNVLVTLSSKDGDLPDEGDVETLIYEQMSGDLGEGTKCLSVEMIGRI